MADSRSARIPYAVQAALIDASGKLFWYWTAYEHYLRSAGVAQSAVDSLTGRRPRPSKYVAMRELLGRLDKAGERGQTVQRRLVESMATIAVSADDGVDVAGAREAQARLRAVAQEHGVLQPPEAKQAERAEREAAVQRRAQAAARAKENRERAAQRQELFREYCVLLRDNADAQGRGYRLEELIGEVAALDGISYTPPFRKTTVVQTDGMLNYKGFHYLIEARWRADPATVNDIASLAHKAGRNLQSARALFLSVAGYRPEVVSELQTGTKNVILFSGHELSMVLEGQIAMDRALAIKVDECAKRGHIFFDLTRAHIGQL